jgi:hypothetical protein
MGSLSNLYISQSYQSLAHLGTNNALSAGTMTLLQDGIGQSLNISFDGTNISSSGNIYAANITASVINTGSFATTSSLTNLSASLTVTDNFLQAQINALDASGSAVSVASLNAFTASQLNINSGYNIFTSSTNSRLTNIETTTASLNTSISNLNTATASLFTSASLSLTTASFNTGSRNLTFTKGNGTQFSVNIPDVSGSNGNFVTTSSFNAYTASNDQKVNSLVSATGSYATTGSNTFTGVQTINALTGTPLIVNHSDATPNQNTFIAFQDSGSAMWAIGNSGLTDSFVVYNPQTFQIPFTINQDNSVNLYGVFTASLATGYTWVGGAGNISKLVATSSFIDNQVSSASFNSYTSSTNSRLNNIESTTASLNTSVTNLNLKTGSYATTGSNSFNGNQIISGTFYQSGSNTLGTGGQLAGTYIKNRVVIGGTDGTNGPTPRLWISGSDGAFATIGRSFYQLDSTPVTGLGVTYTQYADDTSAASFVQGVYNPNDGSNDVELLINTDAASTQFRDWDNSIGDYSTWLTIPINNGNAKPTFARGLIITGSTQIQNFTASLQQGYTWVGNGNDKTTLVATSSFGGTINTASFATTGSNTFIGNQTISGSLLVSGSTQIQNLTASLQQGYTWVGNSSGKTTLVATASFATTGSNLFNGNQTITGSLLVSGSTQVQNFTASLQQGYFFVGNASGITTTVTTSSFVKTNQTSSFAILGSNNNFTGTNIFNGQTTYGPTNDNLATQQLLNNSTLFTKIVSVSSGYNSGSFQQMTMNTGSGGNASFKMQAILSGSTAELNVQNSAGSTTALILSDTILIAQKQGGPNTPATNFTVESTNISLMGNVKLDRGTNKSSDIVSVNGSLTVSNSLVTNNSIILVTTQNGSVAGTEYPAVVMNKGTGTFDIVHNYGGNLDVAYLIINSA